MQVNLGGDRIGSGNKMQVYMHNYQRSTHNLSENFKSTAGVGILYPCYVTPVMRGDKFEMNISAGVRTVPSKAAMFGTYKLQVDYYFCPIRLYVGILHNNPVNLGLNMDKVYFPQIEIYVDGEVTQDSNWFRYKVNTSSLLHYLGLSGLGYGATESANRKVNAVPVLAYYDIFKNYYSNKQEKNAYVLATREEEMPSSYVQNFEELVTGESKLPTGIGNIQSATFDTDNTINLAIRGVNLIVNNVTLELTNADNTKTILQGNTEIRTKFTITATSTNIRIFTPTSQTMDYTRIKVTYLKTREGMNTLKVTPFDLTLLDKMRTELLSYHTMGAPLIINDVETLPYSVVTGQLGDNTEPLNGLMLKTYQSDIFNNWLSAEYIEGINGIANITRVPTEGGGFTIDALNFNEKMYNLLNRIVASGNTYEDWQSVVYENTPKKHLESPMYLGGISQEIIFEEIVSTNPEQTDGNKGGLGAMGGRGISRHRKGGKIRAKFDEAGFIIGIMSITPRVDYGQQNQFYMTDLLTMDDFHKPGLDGIGFQDLIGERMAYFDTLIDGDTITRHSIGKIPAWLEYMTAVDKIHGDFATPENGYMVLNRNYIFDEQNGGIKDATTYIEPDKYNDTFLYTQLDAQNFWVQIKQDIIARRKMSAKLIPNI